MNSDTRHPIRHLAVAAAVILGEFAGLWPADAQEAVGFQDNAVYQRGPTDSLDLYTLNPIVTQPLAPALSISDTLSLGATAYYTGFTWTVRARPWPSTELESIYSRDVASGIIGAGWRFDPGRIWAHVKPYRVQETDCKKAYSVYISQDGGQHIINGAGLTVDGSLIGIVQSQHWIGPFPCNTGSTYDEYITHLQDGHDSTEKLFDPFSGALTRSQDRWGNKIDYTYMEEADFLAVAPGASKEQYTYSQPRLHPVFNEPVAEVVKAPKAMKDSMGRTIEFVYSLPPGFPKFLLTEIRVPAPDGTGVYRLSYVMRRVKTAPPGWPAYAPDGGESLPFLVKVELPEVTGGQGRLSYNYDYDAWGELSEIRYPAGGQTLFEWADVRVNVAAYGPYRRGVVSRRMFPLAGGAGPVHQLRYTKAQYPFYATPFIAPIFDRDRTIITDSAGNETEYRFGDDYFRGFPLAVRHYEGQAPRYRSGAQTVADLDPEFDPSQSTLVRSTTFYYSGRPGDGVDPFLRAEITTFYDDPLTASHQNVSDPRSWSVSQLNTETTDPNTLIYPREYALPEGFARFEIEGDPATWWGTRFPGFELTTEHGNLVGAPRRIQGDYRLNGLVWGYTSPRIVSQGGRASRTDYVGPDYYQSFFKEIQRADPNSIPAQWYEQSPGDIAVTYEIGNPANGSDPDRPDPVPYGANTRITYAGGSGGAPYTISRTYRYGATATSRFEGVDWLETDLDLGPTGLPMAGRDTGGVTTSYAYDTLGRRTAVMPPPPELPTYVQHHMATETYGDGLKTHGYFRAVTTSRGSAGDPDHELSYSEYDGMGRRIKTRRLMADGQWSQQLLSYDAFGAVTFESEWHPLDDFKGEQPPLGTTISYLDLDDPYGRRDPFNRPTRIVAADGSITDISYFGLNARVTVRGLNEDPNQSAATIYYRDYQNRLRILDAPEGADAVYSYDHMNHLIEVKLVDQVQFAPYDWDPNVASLGTDRFMVTNTGGQVRSFEYNALGQLIESRNPEKDPITWQAYDALGNPLLMSDGEGVQHRFSYDAAGHLVLAEVKPPSGEFRKLRQAIYKNSATDDPGGAHGAAALGRPISFRSYGETGAELPLVVRDLLYDPLGRVRGERSVFSSWSPGPDDPALETTVSYHTSGRLSEMIYPRPVGSTLASTRLVFTYAHGFLTRLDSNRQGSDPSSLAPLVASIGYNAAGGLARLELANGVMETIKPDERFRPGRIGFTKGSLELWNSGVYRYDGASNITSMGEESFLYDRIDRLISARVASPADPSLYFTQDYTYDPFGNMTRRSGAAGGGASQVFAVDPGTNHLLRLDPAGLAYTYDRNGAVTKDGLRAYQYDLAGRLSEVRTLDESQSLARYAYDDRGYRISSSSGDGLGETILVRDGVGQVLAEFGRPDSTAAPEWRKDYVYALGRHIAAVENTGPSSPVVVASRASLPGDSNRYVKLTWKPGSDADIHGYDIYRASGGDPGTFLKINAVPVTGSTYREPAGSVAEGSTYIYKIVAVDAANIESEPTALRTIKVGDPAGPPVPQGLTAEAEPCAAVMISWTAVEDNAGESSMGGYNLYRKTATSRVWSSMARNGAWPIQGTSFADDTHSFRPDTTLHYRLEAVDAAGRRSGYTRTLVVRLPGVCGGGRAARGQPESGDGAFLPRFIGSTSPEPPGFRLLYYHVDHLGTPRVITDAAGDVVAKNSFFPFGEAVPPFTSAGNTHWFTGHERDFVAGHDDMLARTYSFYTARFCLPDDHFQLRGMPGGGGLYAYVGGNPLNFRDPTGRDAEGLIYWSSCIGGPASIVGGVMLATGGAVGVLIGWETGVAVPLGVGAIVKGAGLAAGGIAATAQCVKMQEERKKAEERRQRLDDVIEKCTATLEPNACQEAALACLLIASEGGSNRKCKQVQTINLFIKPDRPGPLGPDVPPGPLM